MQFYVCFLGSAKPPKYNVKHINVKKRIKYNNKKLFIYYWWLTIFNPFFWGFLFLAPFAPSFTNIQKRSS